MVRAPRDSSCEDCGFERGEPKEENGEIGDDAIRPEFLSIERNEVYGNHVVCRKATSRGQTIGLDRSVFYVNLSPLCCHECGEFLWTGKFVACAGHGESGRASPGGLNCDEASAEDENDAVGGPSLASGGAKTEPGEFSAEARCPHQYCSERCRDWAWSHYHAAQDPYALAYATEMARTGTTASRHVVLMVSKVASMYRYPDANSKAIRLMDGMMSSLSSISSSLASDSSEVRAASGLADSMALRRLRADPSQLPAMVSMARTTLLADDMDSEWLSNLFVACLAYGVGDSDESSITGWTQFLNHSCVPNVAIREIGRGASSPTSSKGADVGADDDGNEDIPNLVQSSSFPTPCSTAVIALRDVRPGEQLFMSYMDASDVPNRIRRSLLESQYGFVCECELCVRHAEVPHCDACDRPPTAEGPSSWGKLKSCKQCKMAMYCSKQCQMSHWSAHKPYCRKLSCRRLNQNQHHN